MKIMSPEQSLIVRFNNDPKTGGRANCGNEWYAEVEERCATGDVVANAIAIQARFRARGAQSEFEATKAGATKIQALARGKATREKLEQETMPFRVERIVQAMDTDGNGTVHLTELAQFFEVLALQTGETKGDKPKVQARKLVARLTRSDDAQEVSAQKLVEFLTQTFDSPKGGVRIAKMERAMLMVPIRARVIIDPDPPNRAGVDQSLIGQKGVLLEYYNDEKWCYVALDGPGEEDERKKRFNADVVKEDAAYASGAVPEGVPPAGGAEGYDEDSDDEYDEADAVVDELD